MKTTSKKNVWYAIYNGEDEYIAGFPNMIEISHYLCNTRPSFTVAVSRNINNRGNLVRTYNEQENIFECSQKLITYKKHIVNCLGDNLGQGCSVYKFWEETE